MPPQEASSFRTSSRRAAFSASEPSRAARFSAGVPVRLGNDVTLKPARRRSSIAAVSSARWQTNSRYCCVLSAPAGYSSAAAASLSSVRSAPTSVPAGQTPSRNTAWAVSRVSSGKSSVFHGASAADWAVSRSRSASRAVSFAVSPLIRPQASLARRAASALKKSDSFTGLRWMNSPSFVCAKRRSASSAEAASAASPFVSASAEPLRRRKSGQPSARWSGSLISTQPRRRSARSSSSRSCAIAATRSRFIFTMAIYCFTTFPTMRATAADICSCASRAKASRCFAASARSVSQRVCARSSAV